LQSVGAYSQHLDSGGSQRKNVGDAAAFSFDAQPASMAGFFSRIFNHVFQVRAHRVGQAS
jgi:hypothetical protein